MFLNTLTILGIILGENNALAMTLLKKQYILAHPNALILLLENLQVYKHMMPSFKHIVIESIFNPVPESHKHRSH